MSRTIALFDKFTNHILVHTGQNYDYELNEIFFKDLEIRKPNYFLDCAKNSAIETIASVIQKSDEVFLKEAPDAVLLYGDTNSCLSVISAKKRQILFFIWKQEIGVLIKECLKKLIFKIVDHLSDINLVLTEHARTLVKEGISQETIFKTGSHMKEVLNYFLPKINQSDNLKKCNVNKKNYFLVSLHREENVDSKENLKHLFDLLNEIYKKYKQKIIISMHPRTKKNLENFGLHFKNDNIIFSKPFGFLII